MGVAYDELKDAILDSIKERGTTVESELAEGTEAVVEGVPELVELAENKQWKELGKACMVIMTAAGILHVLQTETEEPYQNAPHDTRAAAAQFVATQGDAL